MKILVSIPAYNEEANLGRVIADIRRVLKDAPYSYKILVVDDGSTDRTAEVARQNGAMVVRHPRNLGLAAAFRTEMKECVKLNPDVIVHTDADGQYLARDIPRLVAAVADGYDLVLGSRFMGKIESMPWIKRIGNRAFSYVIGSITNFHITDAQTGFRAFTPEVASINIQRSHTYTQEQVIHALKGNFRIKEVPIYFAKRGANTKSRLIKNPFEYATKAWINILRVYRDYEPLKFFGVMGFVMFAIGFLMGLRFAYYHLFTEIRLGLGQMIFILLLLITSLQIIFFGFLADMFRKWR
jgi:glycosyltransferase involved in cell wall biosynthesis